MALEINLIGNGTDMAMYTSPDRVYVNAAQDKVVPENSEEAAYLLVHAGGRIPMEKAISLGLVSEKAVKPSSNKAVEPDKDK